MQETSKSQIPRLGAFQMSSYWIFIVPLEIGACYGLDLGILQQPYVLRGRAFGK